MGVLLEAFETIILPRRVTRYFRITRFYYIYTWRPWCAIARRLKTPKARETFLGYYGPLSLLLLFVLWAASLIVAFGLLYYSASRSDGYHITLNTCIYMSGTNLFTLGIGDVTPHTGIERVLTVTESGLGFGFLALVLSYLPVIYQAFSRREVNIVLLDARAGSPPSAGELLRRHAGPGGKGALQRFLLDCERWSAELLESHVSYPVVAYFRSQHSNESWLAALVAILDSCALLISSTEDECSRQARLTFAMCRHTVVDLAQVFSAAPRVLGYDRLPPEDLARLRTSLAAAGMSLRATPEVGEKLAKLRSMYEPYVFTLGGYLFMQIPPVIVSAEVSENWKTSAWGRISGLAVSAPPAPGVDDH
ncbi:MAG TPA: potassium channel family protein [Candidatus Acidoferrum sp.]|nr:potassium channel family protein [Candidatus Acidoferrum sp.]